MSTAYYQRTPSVIDGREAFANAGDKANEEHVRAVLEAAWDVTLHPYGGHFTPIDMYAVRDGKPVANVEVKCRTHASDKYATIYLNFRKWHQLIVPWVFTGLPSIFVVKFVNEIRFIDVAKVDARNVRVGGCSRVVKAKSDIEPVIEIPIREMGVIRPRGA